MKQVDTDDESTINQQPYQPVKQRDDAARPRQP
jgi:hypothetical protein